MHAFRYYFFGIASITCVIGALARPATPQAEGDAAFASLQNSVAAISASTRFTPQQKESLSTAANDLISRFVASRGTSTKYALTISLDAATLKTAAGTQNDSVAAGLFRDALLDLTAKQAYAARLLGAQTGLGNDLRVIVTAKRKSAVVSGYFVRANGFGQRSADPPQFIFTKPTMTEPVSMPPGYYVFWLVRNGKRGGDQEEQIGNVDDFTQQVVLEVDGSLP